jgi:very-short-patch-repair endonuclease
MSTELWVRRASVLSARQLRRNQTEAEAVLWKALRGKKFGGVKFNRQKPITVELNGMETFVIVDFYCHSRGLVVEVDGSSHNDQQTEDQDRTTALEANGLRVIRFSNEKVLRDTDSVLATIKEEMTKFIREKYDVPPHPPSILREGLPDRICQLYGRWGRVTPSSASRRSR